MTKFLGIYRGAEIYEIDEFDPSEGEKVGSRVIAKAMLPEQQNMKVDFSVEAGTREKAQEKIQKTIDHYLEKYDIGEFEH
ncbi:hypothetical protein [Fodinibius sediminis]|uniref:Uncharacterized protein n=1 Tax=Fodinibius sediminis TaxID=1214077 RepID=A0A521DBQ5_9BACT|nr:hypothetical protein [Fodinibius sediminis]SMO69045.1 hypothetical protein SAMN06265218_109140 [Fodinibius sediminis]